MQLHNLILEFGKLPAFKEHYHNFYEKWIQTISAGYVSPSDTNVFTTDFLVSFFDIPAREPRSRGKQLRDFECSKTVGHLEYQFSYSRPDTSAAGSYTLQLLWDSDALFEPIRGKAISLAQILERWCKHSQSDNRYVQNAALMLFLAAQLDATSLSMMDLHYDTKEETQQTLCSLIMCLSSDLLHPNKSKASKHGSLVDIITPSALLSDAPSIYDWNITFSTPAVEQEFRAFFSPKKSLHYREYTSDRGAVYQKMITAVLHAADNYPLLHTLIRTPPTDKTRIDNVRAMLQTVTHIQVNSGPPFWRFSATIHPIVNATLALFHDVYKELQEKTYTRMDVMLTLGKAANALSQSFPYALSESEFYPYLSEAEIEVAKTISKAPPSKRFLEVIEGKYRFRFKQMRLVFLGVHDALHRQKQNPRINADDLYTRINEGSFQQAAEHTLWRFDNLVIYTTAYLTSLPLNDRDNLLESLIQDALDASIATRERQQKAIGILSYFLCEGNDFLTNNMRLKIFRATYGQNLYSIQEAMWHYLKNTRIYVNEVEKFFSASFIPSNIHNEELPAPFYFFLWWSVPAYDDLSRNMLRKACQLQHDTWYGRSLSKRCLTDIWDLLDTLLTEFESLTESDLPKPHQIFTLNALLYALANLKVMGQEYNKAAILAHKVDNELLNNTTLSEKLQKACILCDYYTRKNGNSYDRILDKSQNNDFYMLSASIRFISAYQPTWANKYALSDSMITDYTTWYGREENKRWKWLFLRLLAHTNCRIDLPPQQEFDPDVFLAYDHMPSYQDLCTLFH